MVKTERVEPFIDRKTHIIAHLAIKDVDCILDHIPCGPEISIHKRIIAPSGVVSVRKIDDFGLRGMLFHLFGSDFLVNIFLGLFADLLAHNLTIALKGCVSETCRRCECRISVQMEDRKSTRLNSSHVSISYAVFCLKKKMCNLYLDCF